MKKHYFYGIKVSFILMIALAFIALENVVGDRLYQLWGLFGLILCMNLFRWWLKSERALYTLLLDLSALVVISFLSRYVINYFLYAMYLLIIIEAGVMYAFKKSKYLMYLAVGAGIYHYIVLYRFRPNLGIVSEIVFMLLINVLLVFVMYLLEVATREREKQRNLNDQLMQTNEKLEKLTRLEVKTGIAREIHDTFGHDMMGLIMQIEMADVMVVQDPQGAKAMLKDAKVSARQGMQTIRKVVETLRTDEGEIITETVEEMIESFKRKSGIQVILDVDHRLYDLPKKLHDVIYRTIQECMTNSVRHGHARNLEITIACSPTSINFRVKDDGDGADKIKMGYGLRGMTERLQSCGGNVRFKSDQGFEVKGYIEVEHD